MFIKITQVSIEISKMIHFSFTFKLNEKRKVLLKNMIWRGILQGNICWRGGGSIFNRGLRNISKRGGLDKKGVEKNGGVKTLKNTM